MVDYGLPFGKRRRSRLRSSKILIYSKLSRYALVGLIGGIILMFVLFLWYSRDLPEPGKLANAQLGNSTRIYDRKGILLYSVYQEQNRIYVKLS
ncbi:MAG: hypothetical protein HYV38_02340, partial [Candidatus Levybacteria bacterium]|nr:hypothetical protein [Candidatus Levybacteria bacterium]